MNKCSYSMRVVFFLLTTIFFTSCGSLKKKTVTLNRLVGAPVLKELGDPILKDVELSMSSVLALSHSGAVKMNLYNHYLEVSFLSGGVYLNPKFKRNKTYTVRSMEVGLGKYTMGKGGSWRVKNNSPKLIINKTINSVKDTLGITNLKFYIFYNKPTDLKDAWIVAKYYNATGASVYNHSQKLGHYFEEHISKFVKKKLEDEYSGKSAEELIRKQFEIQKKISYEKATYYLEAVKNGKSTSALHKMNFPNRTNNWKRNPELTSYYLKYKKASEVYRKYRDENSDFLVNLKLLREKKISKAEFSKTNKVVFDSLKALNPDKYAQLSKEASSSSKELWLKTGSFYLKDYKAKQKMFPSEWIEDKYIKSFIESSYYEALKEELDFIEKEIIKRI